MPGHNKCLHEGLGWIQLTPLDLSLKESVVQRMTQSQWLYKMGAVRDKDILNMCSIYLNFQFIQTIADTKKVARITTI